MSITREGLARRQAQHGKQLGSLAYERLTLTRRVKEIDAQIASIEATVQANAQTIRDLATDEAIETARAESPAATEGQPDA